jgi:ribose transport system ATP-binding protein
MMMIELKNISKRFPGVKALDRVDFVASAGEIHALVGENGAGKSTLIKVIAGVHRPETGTITFNGREVSWESPQQTRAAGINVIYQEFNLFPELTVANNIFMAQEPLARFRIIDQRRLEARAAELMERLGIDIDPGGKVKFLSVAEQQMIEIAKALAGETRLLILDEPTAVISGREVDILFNRLRYLRDQGVAIIYISHRLEEIFEIAGRVTVLKDGCLVDCLEVAGLDRDRLVSMMVGRELKDIYPPKAESRGEVVLRVEDLTVGRRVRGVGFDLHRGEILGLAGLVGSGRTELAHALFGSRVPDSGRVEIGGRVYGSPSPKKSIKTGIGFLTEDRKIEGLILGATIRANITAPTLTRFARAGFIDFKLEKQACGEEMAKYSIAAPHPEVKVVSLSGGNQQKVLFSRWVRACGGVLILDEPTRGVDVGAKVEIHRIIRGLAEDGVAVLMISSELSEIVGMCDRVVVMREGYKTGELSGEAINEEAIMHLATKEINSPIMEGAGS